VIGSVDTRGLVSRAAHPRERPQGRPILLAGEAAHEAHRQPAASSVLARRQAS